MYKANHHDSNNETSSKSIASNTSEIDDDGHLDNFKKIMKNNKEWAKMCVENQPDYFLRLVNVQKPKYLWIGCSDSRVPANQIIGLKPGQVFVHRNIANIASPSDINFLAVVQYAVQHLGVQDIIVCGHYKCGGIKAAFKQNDFGPLQSWLSHIRELRSKFRQSLLGNQQQKEHTLVELNIKQQVVNVSRVPVVQQAWVNGRNLHIHGVVYNLEDGILRDLGLTTSRIDHVPEEYRLAKKIKNKNNQQRQQQQQQQYHHQTQENHHNSSHKLLNATTNQNKAKRRISKFDQLNQIPQNPNSHHPQNPRNSHHHPQQQQPPQSQQSHHCKCQCQLNSPQKQNLIPKLLKSKQSPQKSHEKLRQNLLEISNLYNS